MKKGILKKDISISILILILVGCSKPSPSLKDSSMRTVGSDLYMKTYKLAHDSIQTWLENNLGYYRYLGKSKKWQLDSLLCFNKEGNRFIGSILMQQLLPDGVADDIDFFYGQKINSNWYFCAGENLFLPRSLYQNDPHTPLSFSKLHEIALKEIYQPYTDVNGNINDSWFTNRFENIGWCAECKTPADFQKNFYESAMAQWANRDTTQPIKRLPSKTLP